MGPIRLTRVMWHVPILGCTESILLFQKRVEISNEPGKVFIADQRLETQFMFERNGERKDEIQGGPDELSAKIICFPSDGEIIQFS